MDSVDIIGYVNCGGFHDIIKTDKNEYYSFGHNFEGQLLIKGNKYNSVCVPTKISKEYIHELIGYESILMDIIPHNSYTIIIVESQQ